jgi:hypothetical protein
LFPALFAALIGGRGQAGQPPCVSS